MGIPYVCLSIPGTGAPALFSELLKRWKEIHRIIRAEKIDVAVSISGISTSAPARLRGIRNVVFTDTEDAKISNLVAFPFADRIYTPRFFLKTWAPSIDGTKAFTSWPTSKILTSRRPARNERLSASPNAIP